MSFAIGSTNRFGILDGEDEEIKQTQAPVKKPAPQQTTQAKAKPKEVKKPAAPAALPETPGAKENRTSKARGPATASNRNLPPKKAKEVQAPGSKRVFDRRSGTGRGKTENKKSGAGKANWGPNNDESINLAEAKEKVEEPTSEAKEEEQKEKIEEGNEQKATQEEKPKEEEEDKTLTLEEYKKKQQKAKTSRPKIRQSGEGVNQDEWKNATLLTREEPDAVTLLVPKKGAKKEEAKKEESPKGKKEGGATAPAESKVPVDQVFSITQEKKFRPRGPPGSENRRGGSKNFRSGGGSKRPSGSGKSFNFTEESFPALTTKA